MDKYAKAIVGALVAGLGAYGVAVADGSPTAEEWSTVAVAFLGALGLIWGVPNSEDAT